MRTSAKAVIAMAGLGLAIAGCGDGNGTDTASPSPSPTLTTTTPAEGGSVASCVTGNWRSTDASGQTGGNIASAGISGGGGVSVKISPAGDVTIDFSTMQPLTFNAEIANAKAAGTFTYAGTASGKIRTGEDGSAPGTPGATGAPTTVPPVTSAPGAADTTGTPAAPGGDAGATSGTWEPVPPINWGDARVTVDLTEPVKAQLFDNVRIAEYVGDGAAQSGNVVDIEPLLGEGRYQCQGQTLILTPKDQQGITWTLARA